MRATADTRHTGEAHFAFEIGSDALQHNIRQLRTFLVVFFGMVARVSAVTIVVNDNGDALHNPGCAVTGKGVCTFRDAITFANANPGIDTIGFAIGTGLATIMPSTSFPNITEPIVIDGTTQPGFAGSPLIELDGGNLLGMVDGLTIMIDGCTVRGLVINDFPGNGIHLNDLSGIGGSLIAGNFIGTNAAATSAKPNGGQGILVSHGRNTIGGIAVADRNLISGNLGDGIYFQDGNALVQGNFIGTDSSGLIPIGNRNGIFVSGTEAT